MNASVLPFDPHLLGRLRAAGEAIVWRPIVSADAVIRARLARLHDEEARVEIEEGGRGEVTLRADPGPVGALVLLLEIDRRGDVPRLRSAAAGSEPGFPQGAIVARWPRGGPASGNALDLPLSDLVVLARYALV